MVKAIIFDCFGVLTTDIWLKFSDSLPPETDFAQLAALNRAYDKGIISMQDFQQEVQNVCGKFPPDLENLDGAGMVKNEAMFDLIRQLKPDYKIGILSNIAGNWITTGLLTPEELPLFDTIVMSHEVGMVKPDPRIFILTCERLRVTPDEALMIDGRDAYAEAARAAGLQGITYEGMRSFKAQLNELLNTNY